MHSENMPDWQILDCEQIILGTSPGKRTQRAYARAEPAEEAGEWQVDWQACRQELWSLALISLVGNNSQFNILFTTKTLIYRLQ